MDRFACTVENARKPRSVLFLVVVKGLECEHACVGIENAQKPVGFSRIDDRELRNLLGVKTWIIHRSYPLI